METVGFWAKLFEHAPALAAIAIVVVVFVRYLRSEADRHERSHARFSDDLKGVTEAHERALDRAATSFDNSNKRLIAAVEGREK